MLNTEICDHAAAEPVVTLEGETVGAICPACDMRLPTLWIGCTHERLIETRALCEAEPRPMCLHCGVFHKRKA